MWCHAVLQHGCFYSNGKQYSSKMKASFYIIVRNCLFINFSIRGSSAWWSRTCMVRMTALDIQVSLRNPMAMLDDSMTLVKMLYCEGRMLPVLGLKPVSISTFPCLDLDLGLELCTKSVGLDFVPDLDLGTSGHEPNTEGYFDQL